MTISSISPSVKARSSAPSSAKVASDVAEIGVAALMLSITRKATFSSRARPSPASASASRKENGSPKRTRAVPRLSLRCALM